MDNVMKRINIDLYSPTSYEPIQAQQGDNNSRVIEFILYDKGEPYAIPQNTLIRMEGHRGDQSSFIKENCTLSDNVIRATLDDDILYAHGIVEAKIILTQRAEKESSESNGNSHDVILSTIPFRIHVQKNPCDKTKVEAEKRSLIDYLIQKLRELKDTLTTHISDKTNPHNVTKAQVGLGNADNTADKDKYVASANQLTTPRTIDGVSFNRTKSIAHYCICPSLGNAAAKTASLPGFQLVNGAKAAVLFQYGNTAASPTLTVNNTGAKPIHYNGEAISLANAPILKGCCEFVYDGLGHWLLTGRHTFVKGASETAYRDGLVSLTPADIGASPSDHTHSYAGSASPGGPATSANKLNTDAGSQKQPVYFKNGIPIACEDISNYQEVTQAEYERLTASEKEDVVFYITDADETLPNATAQASGLMSAEDKKKLDGIATEANRYSLPAASPTTRGGVKTGYEQNGSNYPVQLDNERMYVNVPQANANGSWFGVCGSAPEDAAKKVDLDGFVRFNGVRAVIYFSWGNTAENITLEINGTGAAEVHLNGQPLPANVIRQASAIEVAYHWNYWRVVGFTANETLPSISMASSLQTLDSGEPMSTAFGKISKAISDLSHHLEQSAEKSICIFNGCHIGGTPFTIDSLYVNPLINIVNSEVNAALLEIEILGYFAGSVNSAYRWEPFKCRGVLTDYAFWYLDYYPLNKFNLCTLTASTASQSANITVEYSHKERSVTVTPPGSSYLRILKINIIY